MPDTLPIFNRWYVSKYNVNAYMTKQLHLIFDGMTQNRY